MTERDDIDPVGLEAAVRECARITAPEISDEEYEQIKAENSARYQNTRADMERTIRAYLRNLAASVKTGEAVEVRPLEWRDHSFEDDILYIARTPWEDYRITFTRDYTWPWVLKPFLAEGSNYQTLDAAKAAAQADYEARIRSALVMEPVKAEPALDELLSACAAANEERIVVDPHAILSAKRAPAAANQSDVEACGDCSQASRHHSGDPQPSTSDPSNITYRIGRWLSAALDDPKVCAEMKADILAWMEAGKPNVEPSDAPPDWKQDQAETARIKPRSSDPIPAEVDQPCWMPTPEQINSACLSFRHDFGLLNDDERAAIRFEAREWLRAWQKEGFGCDRNEVIERCAAVVDQCNREGPYQAIAAAGRIRALLDAFKVGRR